MVGLYSVVVCIRTNLLSYRPIDVDRYRGLGANVLGLEGNGDVIGGWVQGHVQVELEVVRGGSHAATRAVFRIVVIGPPRTNFEAW